MLMDAPAAAEKMQVTDPIMAIDDKASARRKKTCVIISS
jgi:hypothetical protein